MAMGSHVIVGGKKHMYDHEIVRNVIYESLWDKSWYDYE